MLGKSTLHYLKGKVAEKMGRNRTIPGENGLKAVFAQNILSCAEMIVEAGLALLMRCEGYCQYRHCRYQRGRIH